MDSTVIKVDAATAPTGPEGEVELAVGTALAMRRWHDAPADRQSATSGTVEAR
jgi:hypothetical protein